MAASAGTDGATANANANATASVDMYEGAGTCIQTFDYLTKVLGFRCSHFDHEKKDFVHGDE